MNKLSFLASLAFIFLGCGGGDVDTINFCDGGSCGGGDSTTSSSSVGGSTDSTTSSTSETTSSTQTNICNNYYNILVGDGFSTWAAADGTGDYARGGDSNGKFCAVWHPVDSTIGNLYCVDNSKPVDKIYFKDPNQNGKCVEWTDSVEPWFIWQYCGQINIGQ